jgi:heme a synthase
MNPPAAYDLTPALSLMLAGIVVALGPLAWVWLRSRRAPLAQRLHVLTLVTLFLTIDLVIFGAFTRLTDSGLGCPDWPGCYGNASPVGAQQHIEQAQTAMPTGPVTHTKAWIEMVHRYLATGVGVLILTMLVVTWSARRSSMGADSLLGGRRPTRAGERGPEISIVWPVLTLLWVCLQGAFGALTVTMKLFPAIVTLHLLGGMVLLTLLRAQSVFYAQAFEKQQGFIKPRLLGSGMRAFLLLAFVLLWLQIALGGWVSTNYAVLACTEFPGCQGSLWPDMKFSEGFTLWRELGAGPAEGSHLTFQALTAIHYAHRIGAYVLFGVMGALAFRLASFPGFRRDAMWLGALLLAQVATGLGNVLLGWPLAAAVLHTAGAAGLVVLMTGLVLSVRTRPEVIAPTVPVSRPAPILNESRPARLNDVPETATPSQPMPIGKLVRGVGRQRKADRTGKPDSAPAKKEDQRIEPSGFLE